MLKCEKQKFFKSWIKIRKKKQKWNDINNFVFTLWKKKSKMKKKIEFFFRYLYVFIYNCMRNFERIVELTQIQKLTYYNVLRLIIVFEFLLSFYVAFEFLILIFICNCEKFVQMIRNQFWIIWTLIIIFLIHSPYLFFWAVLMRLWKQIIH